MREGKLSYGGMKGYRARKVLRKTVNMIPIYILLIAASAITALPLYWTATRAVMGAGEIYLIPPKWIPPWPLRWSNFTKALNQMPFGQFFANTAFVTVMATAGTVLSSSLVAYSFARFRAPGSRVLFGILLATIMVPYEVRMIPTFILFKYMGWLNTYLPLIVPTYFGISAFYIFLLRQFMLTIPLEIDDAAKIDGCSAFGIYWRMILPLCKPALASVAIFTFVANWNDFLGPLIYLKDKEKYTVSLGLAFYSTESGLTNPAHVMAVTLLTVLPIIVLFFFTQKTFIQGIVTTGLKG